MLFGICTIPNDFLCVCSPEVVEQKFFLALNNNFKTDTVTKHGHFLVVVFDTAGGNVVSLHYHGQIAFSVLAII